MSKSNKPRYSRRAEPTRVNDILCWEQAAHDAPVIVHWRNGETCVSRCYMSIDYVLAHEHAKEVFDHLPAEATECAPELPQPCVPAAKKLVYEAMTYAPPAEASVPAPQIRYGVREPDGTRTVIVEDEAPAPQSAPQGEVKTFMEDDSRCQSTIRAIVERVMMRLGADHADFRLRDELIVLAAPYLHKHERTVAELLEEVERLKDPDKYSVPHDVQERIKELRTELSERKATARRAAQMLIEEVGAQGPENVDETAVRTVNKIKAMRERADELTARAEAAEAERDDLRAKLEQAEAGAAEMREALEGWANWCRRELENDGKSILDTIMVEGRCDVCCCYNGHHDDCEVLLTHNALSGTAGSDLLAKVKALEAEVQRLKNQLRIEYSRNDALARIRDAVGRIAQVFGDDVYRMPIDSEIGCVQYVLNRYKELERTSETEALCGGAKKTGTQ